MKRALVWGLAALLMAGCSRSEEGVLSGIVEVREVRLAFEEPGTLEAVAVDVGDAVEKGGEVARLDGRELAIALERARYELKKARADLQNLLNSPRPEALTAARAREKAAAALLQNASDEFERSRKLYEKGVATDQSFRQRETEFKQAREAHGAAKADRELLEAGSKEEAVSAQEMQIAALEKSVELLEVRLEKYRLHAPVSGRVLTRNFEPGEYVRAGQSVVTVADPEDCWVVVYVPEASYGEIATGQEVAVRFDVDAVGSVKGKIGEIAEEASFAPRMNLRKEQRSDLYFRVEVRLDNSRHLLKPGMIADVFLRR